MKFIHEIAHFVAWAYALVTTVPQYAPPPKKKPEMSYVTAV